MQQTLNNLYSDYLSGKLVRPQFEGLIYNYFVFNQEKTCLSHWKREEYEDYISWFYPRLHKAIDAYRETGASFEAFMAKFLLISSKEYRVRVTSNAVIEYSTWCAQVPDLYVYEEPHVYIHKDVEKTISDLITDKKGRKSTRRMLALILKCYNYISEDFAEKIAPKIGIDAKELLEMLKNIRNIRQKRDDNIFYMKERIYSQFFRCLIYEKKLSLIEENPTVYNKEKLKLERARQRLKSMRERIKNIRTEATNSQVAKIIGISKGTVDASLHQLKNSWKVMAKNMDLN
jgi:DNA-binding transcriptional regulator GbsR (MarR family)